MTKTTAASCECQQQRASGLSEADNPAANRDYDEFVSAIRKGGKLTKQAISDQDLKKLFNAIDDDGSGDLSIRELVQFVWGEGSPEARNVKTPPKKANKFKTAANAAVAASRFAKSVDRKQRSNQHAEAEAADPMLPLKKKLRGLSYGSAGQDPTKVFSRYDKDNSGELDYEEFVSAIRKGGKMTKNTISDQELRKLFDAIDGDGSGDISIRELAQFVWGEGSPEARNVKTPVKKVSKFKAGALAASFAMEVERKERSEQHAAAEAADPNLSLKKKLRGLSYGGDGQDPSKLFSRYDADNSGEL